MGKLEGKVALVTGSGRNIGRATVLRLAGEGAHVVVNERSDQQEAETVAREARDLGVRAVPILADVGKKAEVGGVVSPGSIDTRRDNPEWYQGHLPNAAGVPLGRQGSVDEIAATCLFLVSEDAAFITGQTIHVNGGAHYY